MGYRYATAFCNTLKEFCKSTSCTGFAYIVDPKRTWFERSLWCILQLGLFGAAVIIVLHTWEDITENPLVISLESSNYPIQSVPFPAISVCNINKISKRRAFDFADYLSKRANLRRDDVFDQIKTLGKLYDYEIDSGYDSMKFQAYLDDDGANQTNNLYYIMKNLSTPCEELLYKCTWKGEVQNCSAMFELQPTYEGFCCVFNYHIHNPLEMNTKPLKEPERVEEAGWHEGLIVVVYNEPEDYFYPVMSSVGVNMHIFDPYDYPDATSGSLIEELSSISTETFLTLDVHTVYSVPEVRTYPVATRKCMFEDEVSTLFGKYSLSNCLVQCRIESILALCQCVPFNMPSHLDISECTLSDIPCLNKYQGKWQNLYPRDFKSDELEHEKQNALSCPNCYTTCSDTLYHVRSNSVPLNLRGLRKQQYENFSAIRVYFGNEHSQLFKHDVVFYWFEILSNFGGLLGIFLGVSFMSIIEFLYFITFRFILILKKFKV